MLYHEQYISQLCERDLLTCRRRVKLQQHCRFAAPSTLSNVRCMMNSPEDGHTCSELHCQRISCQPVVLLCCEVYQAVGDASACLPERMILCAVVNHLEPDAFHTGSCSCSVHEHVSSV